MAFLKSKGTLLKHEVATVLTTLAQVISIDGPGPEPEETEFDYLDNANAAIPYEPTGRVEGGDVSFEMFLDTALAGHRTLLAKGITPDKEDYSITFANSNVWTFEGIFKGCRPTVDLASGVKASCSIKLTGIPTYPA